MQQATFTRCWQLACSRHHLVPAVHDLLLQVLGCSSKAVLLAAAALAASPCPDDHKLYRAGFIESSFIRSAVLKEPLIHAEFASLQDPGVLASKGLDHNPDLLSAGQIERQLHPCAQWSAAEHKMHLLLPSVMLLS
jgi:hypothetical protein